MQTKIKGLLCAAGLLVASLAQANGYPNRPITLIVPFPPGGAADATARILADDFGQRLGQQIIVENQNGAGGTIGSARVSRAKPDGYTLLLNNMSQSTVNVFYENLPYDALKDFSSIGSVAYLPMMLVANGAFPESDSAKALEYIKNNRQRLTLATSGMGSTTELCGRLIQRALGLSDLVEVPYKGSGPALIDVIGGQVDMTCDSSPSTVGYLNSGKLKAFAMTSAERDPGLPSIPTFKELGYDLDLSLWFAMYAPAGTSADIVAKLSDALQQSVQDPKFTQRLTGLGAYPESPEQATPQALDARMEKETKRWRELFKG